MEKKSQISGSLEQRPGKNCRQLRIVKLLATVETFPIMSFVTASHQIVSWLLVAETSDTRPLRNVPFNGCMHLKGLQTSSTTKPSSGNTSFKGALTLLRLPGMRFHPLEGQHCKPGPVSWHRAVLALRESLHSLSRSISLPLERMRVTVADCLRVQFATPLLKKFRNSEKFSFRLLSTQIEPSWIALP